MSSAIIEVTDVKKAFLVGTQTVEILHGVTASINMGDFVIIVGPSGCGKSTLLHIILGLEKPTEGEVLFLQERIYNDTTEDYRSDFRKKHIGMVYQQPNWVKSMTVAENVGFPMLLLGMEREAARERALMLLDKLKMREWADYMPTELSGGQQQRVSLARALSNNPEIIIADEPTGNLDFQTGQEVMLMLQDLNQTEKKTIVMVTHDLEYLKYANSAIKMLFYSLNVAYHEIERRHPVRFNLSCMAFTVSAFLAVQLSAALVVGVPVVLGLFGLAEEWSHLTLLRWPVLLVIYVAALALAYRIGPSRQRARWRWVVPGAIFAGLLSLGLSFGFSWYVQTFVRTASYGPLAAMMGFLLWTWLTVQIVILGAELNAEMEHQTAVDTTTGAPRPIGERGARVADSVGPRQGSSAALSFTLRHAEALSDRLLKRRIRRQAGRD